MKIYRLHNQCYNPKNLRHSFLYINLFSYILSLRLLFLGSNLTATGWSQSESCHNLCQQRLKVGAIYIRPHAKSSSITFLLSCVSAYSLICFLYLDEPVLRKFDKFVQQSFCNNLVRMKVRDYFLCLDLISESEFATSFLWVYSICR